MNKQLYYLLLKLCKESIPNVSSATTSFSENANMFTLINQTILCMFTTVFEIPSNLWHYVFKYFTNLNTIVNQINFTLNIGIFSIYFYTSWTKYFWAMKIITLCVVITNYIIVLNYQYSFNIFLYFTAISVSLFLLYIHHDLFNWFCFQLCQCKMFTAENTSFL